MRDLLYALRDLRRTPGFALTAILSLGLGIGLNAALFTLTNAIFLKPLPVKDPAGLAQIGTIDTLTRVTGAANPRTPVSLANLRDIRAQQGSFASIAADVTFSVTLATDGAAPQSLNATLVTADYFETLGLRPALGQFLPGATDERIGAHALCVLSHSVWVGTFGADGSIVGRKILLNSAPYVVTGVAPAGFKGTSTVGDPNRVWLPLTQYRDVVQGLVADLFETRRFRLFNLTGRLQEGVTLGQASAEMSAIGARLERDFPVDNKGRTLTAEPLANAVLGIPPDRVWLASAALTGAASLVLLIACVNVANLLLVRSVRRSREFGLRAALGAGRGRLVRQLFTESLLLAGAGCLVGLVLAYWGRNLLWSFRPSFLNANDIDLSFDARVLLFAMGVSVLTAMLFSLAPAWRASTPDLNALLRAAGSRGASAASGRLKGVLVAVEVAFCFVALAGAGLFLRSMQRVHRIDPGLDTERTVSLTFNLATLRQPPGQMTALARQLLERARTVPGVESAALSTSRPMGGFALMGTYFKEGQGGDLAERPFLGVLDSVTGDFFTTARIAVLQGRTLNDFDRASSAPVAVVNEAFASAMWPGENALGKRFFRLRENVLREVVGVVRNTARVTPGETPRPAVYLPVEQFYQPGLALVTRAKGDPAATGAALARALQPLAPTLRFSEPIVTQAALADGLWAPRMGAALFGLFGLLGLALAAIGVHGVVAYAAAERTREMGIRLALGSTPSAIARLVVGQGLWPIAAGLVAGLAATALLGPRLAELLFETPAADPAVLTAMAVVLVLAGVAAAALPAWRASRLDPVAALRED